MLSLQIHIVRSRMNYERLIQEVGANCTLRSHQASAARFYFDFSEMKCNNECKNEGIRLKFHCDIASFIKIVKSLYAVQVIKKC